MGSKAFPIDVIAVGKSDHEALTKLSRVCARVSNAVWKHWLLYHVACGHDVSMRDYIARSTAWEKLPADEKKKADRPECPVNSWPNELGRKVYRAVADSCPELHGRSLVLLIQKVRGNIVTKKSSARPGRKWWSCVLTDDDGIAICRHNQPIPFDGKNARFVGFDDKGNARLCLTLERVPVPGRKNATSRDIIITLRTAAKNDKWTDKRAAKWVEAIREMADGKRPVRGGTIYRHRKKKKWMVAISFTEEKADAKQVDSDKVLILRPGKNRCWQMRTELGTVRAESRREWPWDSLIARGNHVAHKRKSILSQRWGRQSSYTLSPPRKGHGKNRALAPLFKLTLAWTGFTKRSNEVLSHDVIEFMRSRGIGRLVFVRGNDSRRLATAGKIDDRRDASGWPWQQVATFLAKNCNKSGMKFVDRPAITSLERCVKRSTERTKRRSVA